MSNIRILLVSFDIKGSTVRNCAAGVISSNTQQEEIQIYSNCASSKFENNISIATNNVMEASKNGFQPIAKKLFTQRYFENSLGWDFDSVWRWDDKTNHPVLRDVGVGSKARLRPKTPEQSSVDLLTVQMKANIWI